MTKKFLAVIAGVALAVLAIFGIKKCKRSMCGGQTHGGEPA